MLADGKFLGKNYDDDDDDKIKAKECAMMVRRDWPLMPFKTFTLAAAGI